jgi:16S rRNA (guanine527-N7)-methyltransferase
MSEARDERHWDKERSGGTARGRSVAATPAEAVERFGPAASQLHRYAEMLATEGVLRGLIGPREVSRMWDRHILNSAALLPLLPGPRRIADVGSGAGLPGLVIGILRPDLSVTLVEPLLRRVNFLTECVDQLQLANCYVLRSRAEEATDLSVDSVVARAVAPLDRLAKICLPLLEPGGELLALKGAGAAAELRAAEPGLRGLGALSWSVVRLRPPFAVAEATVVKVVAGGQI